MSHATRTDFDDRLILARRLPYAYHFGMQRLGWTLVFTAASFEHLAERDIDADDVADTVFGRHGPARVRRGGRGVRLRWFVKPHQRMASS